MIVSRALQCFGAWLVYTVVCFAQPATSPIQPARSSPLTTNYRSVIFDSTRAVAARARIPTYHYDEGPIRQWLLLGPIPADQRPSDPRVLLEDLLDGIDTYWAGDNPYRWEPFQADATGEVWLTTFSRYQGLRAANSVVYAVCRLAPSDNNLRQYYFGVDDSGTLWLGDNQPVFQEGPNWYDMANVRANLAIDPDSDNYCFAELVNSTGRFTFSVFCGKTIEGRTTAWDGETPRDWVALQAATPSGQPVSKAYSRDNGRFTLEAVPYDVSTHVEAIGTQSRPTADPSGRIKLSVARRSELALRETGRREKGAKEITAIDVSDAGHVYFSSGYNGAVHRSIGRRTERLIEPDLGKIGQIQYCAPGVLHLLQSDGGFLCSGTNAWQYCGTPVVGFRYFGEEKTVVDCAVRDSDGKIWLTTTGSTGRFHELIHLSSQGALLGRWRQRMRIMGLAVNKDYVFVGFDIGVVEVLKKPVNSATASAKTLPTKTLPNSHLARIVGLKLEDQPSGNQRLWAVGADAVCYLNPDQKSWTRLLPPEDAVDLNSKLLPVPRHAAIAVWQNKLFRLEGTDWQILQTDDSISCIAATPTGIALAGTTSGRILELHDAKYVVRAIEDGLAKTSMIRVQEYDGDVLVSTRDKSPRWIRRDGTVDILTHLPSDMHFYLGDDQYLRLPFLHSNYPEKHPYSRDGIQVFSADGKTRELGKPGSEDALYYLCHCQLRDGSILVATNHGVYKVAGNRNLQPVTDSAGRAMLPELQLYRMFEAPDGKIWFNYNQIGLGWWDPVNGESKLAQNKTVANRATSFAKGNNGLLYVGTENGLYTVAEDSLELTPEATDTIGTAEVSDVQVAPGGRVWVSTRYDGVYSLRSGTWLKLTGIPQLDDSTLTLTDIDISPSGELWVCKDNCVINYAPASVEPTLFVDSVSADGVVVSSSETALSVKPVQIEEGSQLSIHVSTWDDPRVAALQYRELPGGSWKRVDQGHEIAITVSGLGEHAYEIRCIDRDHNCSAPITVKARAFLPWYRSTTIRVLGGLLIAITLGVAVYSGVRASIARRRQFDAQRQAREIAEQRVAEREHLLHRVSHDLRNPIFVIGGCAEMVQSGELEYSEAFRILQESADSMEYLTSQLLSYSRAKSEHLESDYKVVDVREFLQSVTTHTKLAYRDGCELAIHVGPSAPRRLKLAVNATTEILHNLLSNAIKNTPEGGVLLRCAMIAGKPMLQVEDNGCGMSPEFAQKAFEPFVGRKSKNGNPGPTTRSENRNSTSPSDRIESYGLGLSICQMLATEIGAKLKMESQIGVGTKVSLTLPSKALDVLDAVPPQTHQPAENQPSPHEGLHTADSPGSLASSGMHRAALPHMRFVDANCLVVDDVAFVRETTVHRLASAGITAFDCGPGNLPSLENSAIRVVVTDLQMPAMSGFVLAEKIRRLNLPIAIVAYSERSDLLREARASELFDAVFAKSDILSNRADAMATLSAYAGAAPSGQHI